MPLFKTLARKAAGGSQVSADEFLSLGNFTALKFTNPSFYGANVNKGTEQKRFRNKFKKRGEHSRLPEGKTL